jgi:hypothetical protein
MSSESRDQSDPLREADVQGLKYFNKLGPLLKRLRDVGCQRDKAGNRQLFMDQYCALVLLFLFNPCVRSQRAPQQASELRRKGDILLFCLGLGGRPRGLSVDSSPSRLATRFVHDPPPNVVPRVMLRALSYPADATPLFLFSSGVARSGVALRRVSVRAETLGIAI